MTPAGKRFISVLLAVIVCGLAVGAFFFFRPSSIEQSAIPTVSSEVQSNVERVANSFVADLQKKQYADAAKLTSPSFAAHQPNQLATEASSTYLPLVNASPLTFEPGEDQGHGKKVVLHALFTADDGKQYRTNFIFLNDKSDWQISVLMKPVGKTPKPVTSHTETQNSSG